MNNEIKLTDKVTKENLRSPTFQKWLRRTLCFVAILSLIVQAVGCFAFQTYAAEDDSIVGTWVFNDTLTRPTYATYNIDYYYLNSSNAEVICTKIGFESSPSQYVTDGWLFRYSLGTGARYSAYSWTVDGDYKWQNENYKTITITGGTDITNETFITWLKANATKQVDTSGDSNSGTSTTYTIPSGIYTLNDEITFPETAIEQEFTFSSKYGSLAEGITTVNFTSMTFDTNVLVYSNTDTTKIAFYGTPYTNYGYSDIKLKLLTVDTVQTVSEEFYNIFFANVYSSKTSDFVYYENELLPPLPDGVDTNSRYVFISKINASSVSSELDGKYYYILDVANTEPVVTYSGSYVVFAYKQGGTSLYRYIYSPHNEVVTALANQGNKASSTAWGEPNIATPSTSTSYGVDAIVWSAFDIKNEDGTLFFQTPSEVLPTVIQTEILTGVMREIVMILPIGMVCLISYMALRKGLKILLQTLRTA